MSDIIYRLAEPEDQALECLGSQDASIFIVIEQEKYDDKAAQAIKSMISALGKSMETDVLVIGMPDAVERLNLFSVISIDAVQQLIAIGIVPERLGFQMDLDRYHIGQLENFTLMHTDDMATILSEQKLKNIFWNQLKKQFNK